MIFHDLQYMILFKDIQNLVDLLILNLISVDI